MSKPDTKKTKSPFTPFPEKDLDNGPYQADELEAIALVRKACVEKGLDLSKVDERVIIACTMIGKLRVEKSVESVEKWIGIQDLYSVPKLFESGWEKKLPELGTFFEKYAVCGRDEGGRNVMWINPDGGIEIKDENSVLHAACYFMIAMNADMHTMRHGSSMIMDVQVPDRKIGNEKKLQKTWQEFPNRPQHIILINASMIKRILVNALVKFASVFSSNKIFSRLRFGQLDDVTQLCMPDESLPQSHGGPDRGSSLDWVTSRLTNFPMPPGKSNVDALAAKMEAVKVAPKVVAL